MFCQSGKAQGKLDQKTIELFYVASLKTIVSRHFLLKINYTFGKTCSLSMNIGHRHNILMYFSCLHAVLAWNCNLIWSHKLVLICIFKPWKKVREKWQKYWKSQGISWDSFLKFFPQIFDLTRPKVSGKVQSCMYLTYIELWTWPWVFRTMIWKDTQGLRTNMFGQCSNSYLLLDHLFLQFELFPFKKS